MRIEGKVALITGAASGIGQAVAFELARRGARALALVDRSLNTPQIAEAVNEAAGRPVAEALAGDTTDADFRARVYDQIVARHGVVHICVPAAGITRDALAVKVDKQTGKAVAYPLTTFREVIEIDLIAPVYWALEMVVRVAEERRRCGLGRWEPAEPDVWGTVVFVGSVSAQGNKGQIAYAASKSGLGGAAATLMKEAIYHGVRCCIIHPGFTDTPMVRVLGEEYIAKNILPYTQLRRLIRPDEIADAICFLISNSAVSGELWADAGWHPSA
jgi:NAD(P)-dependent dehydrogenase (short-subunit alcohol dehydrogenase family)